VHTPEAGGVPGEEGLPGQRPPPGRHVPGLHVRVHVMLWDSFVSAGVARLVPVLSFFLYAQPYAVPSRTYIVYCAGPGFAILSTSNVYNACVNDKREQDSMMRF